MGVIVTTSRRLLRVAEEPFGDGSSAKVRVRASGSRDVPEISFLASRLFYSIQLFCGSAATAKNYPSNKFCHTAV